MRLKNFKSHSDTFLTFDKITSIIGTSQSGKSHIYRALKMVMYNDDFPEAWIKTGESESEVEVEFEHCTIVRTRSTKGQKIKITTKDSVVEQTGVRDATPYVLSLLGDFRPSLDESENEDLHFIGVHDTPFLITNSPQLIQRKISGIMGISKLEEVRLKLSKDLKNLIQKKESYSDKINELANTIGELEPIYNECKNKLEACTNFINKIDDLDESLKVFHSISNSITNIDYSKIRKKFERICNCLLLLKYYSLEVPVFNSDKLMDLDIKLSQLRDVEDTILICQNIEEQDGFENTAYWAWSFCSVDLKLVNENIAKELKRLGKCPTCGNDTTEP